MVQCCTCSEISLSLNLVQGHSTKYTKRNFDIHPFEAGGETRLEHFVGKADCGVVVSYCLYIFMPTYPLYCGVKGEELH